MSALQSSAPTCWLPQPILWTSPSEVYCAPLPLTVICFVPAEGIIPSDLGLDLSLSVRLSTFPLLRESRLAVVCVPWLGALTPATSVNGLDWSFSGFRLVWDFAAYTPNPSGSSHHCTQFSLCSLEAGAFMVHAFLLCCFSLFFARSSS